MLKSSCNDHKRRAASLFIFRSVPVCHRLGACQCVGPMEFYGSTDQIMHDYLKSPPFEPGLTSKWPHSHGEITSRSIVGREKTGATCLDVVGPTIYRMAIYVHYPWHLAGLCRKAHLRRYCRSHNHMSRSVWYSQTEACAGAC